MRRAVATDCTLAQQCCVVELSAVATRETPLQRMGNRVGCVVARTCLALLQHAMRWETACDDYHEGKCDETMNERALVPLQALGGE